MKKMFVLAALATLMISGVAATAQGGIIYNNGLPDQVYGTQMSEFLVAENFSIGAAANITNIRFWSIQSAASDYLGSVYWGIYADAPGEPGGVLHSNVSAVAAVATGMSTGFSYDEYVFDIPVAFQLAAGNYWLGLHNGSLANTAPSEMLWSTTGGGTAPTGLYFDQGWWDSGNEHAFRLDGGPVNQVPEPSTLTLFVGGLAIAFVRRRITSKR